MRSMMGKGTLRVWALSAALAALFTAAAGSGLLDRADGAVSDALYQRPSAADGQIVVVGLDQRALDALAPCRGPGPIWRTPSTGSTPTRSLPPP